MTIEYPEIVKCPYCGGKIRINYDNGLYAGTEDLFTLIVNIPFSLKSGTDGRNNKQNISPSPHRLTVCNQCRTILSINVM